MDFTEIMQCSLPILVDFWEPKNCVHQGLAVNLPYRWKQKSYLQKLFNSIVLCLSCYAMMIIMMTAVELQNFATNLRYVTQWK